jgi:hypothetical protein
MSDEAKRLGESFVTAYELIRGLTETVSDLTMLVTPLVMALDTMGIIRQRPLVTALCTLQLVGATRNFRSTRKTGLFAELRRPTETGL